MLAAYTNGLTLFFIALAIVWEAMHRLREPATVLGGPMLAVAVLGLAVNIAAFVALHGAERDNLNVRAHCCMLLAISWARLPPSLRPW